MPSMTAIYRLAIRCVAGLYLKEPFLRVVEVKTSTTLNDLHKLIRKLTDFDDDHLTTFYLANTLNGRKAWLVDPDEMDDAPDIWREGPLWKIRLSEIYPLPKHKKLYYWFDFGDCWIFEIASRERNALPRQACAIHACWSKKAPNQTNTPSGIPEAKNHLAVCL
jgi:hypothetical protein